MIRVAVAGTFNVIHRGHIALLEKAFEVGDVVHIGLTSDEMAGKARNVPVQSYEIRENNLSHAVSEFARGKQFSIVPIKDIYGPSVHSNYDIIVVSEDTEKHALGINGIRQAKGLKPLEIVVIKMVLADDDKAISSTRIMKGDIDKEGRAKLL